MDNSHNSDPVHRPMPSQGLRGSRSYKLFKNPPQPHMCIQDSIKGTSEKLYINVMSWKKIGNAKPCADLIPLYGGMQIPHGCNPNCNKPPLTVFAVMVNPEILKVNGKHAPNPQERDALVTLLCDFVEAMNPGLRLTRQPIILKDRDLAGELKDVWHAVQLQREREKLRSQESNNEITHKIYHIDGPMEQNLYEPMNNGPNNCNKNVSVPAQEFNATNKSHIEKIANNIDRQDSEKNNMSQHWSHSNDNHTEMQTNIENPSEIVKIDPDEYNSFLLEYSSPKYDKLKPAVKNCELSNKQNIAPELSNNHVNNKQTEQLSKSGEGNISLTDIANSMQSEFMEHKLFEKNYFPQSDSINQCVHSNKYPINFSEDKDIPFVDEYSDYDNVQILKDSSTVDEMIKNIVINSSIEDRNTDSSSSHK